jgi:hypothetical protein
MIILYVLFYLLLGYATAWGVAKYESETEVPVAVILFWPVALINLLFGMSVRVRRKQ